MPTYEYRCDQCSHQFEVFASMSEPAPEACDACGAAGTLQKVLFPVAVHYKGSGFYSTDYKGGSRGAGSGTAGEANASSATSDSGGAADSGGGASSAGAGTSASAAADA